MKQKKDINILLNNKVDIEKSLELFGDIETYDETLEEFLEGINKRINDLKQFKEIADMNNYSILVHSLKSDAKYFGFNEMAELCLKHEMESKANNIYYIYDNFAELKDVIEKMVNVAKMYLGEEINLKEEKKEIISDKTILIVDDSDVIQNFIKKIFESKYNVVTAKNGEEAIDYIIDHKHDIKGMFLDLNMPHLNGFAVLNFIDKENLFSKIPVTIITGVGAEELINQTSHYPIVGVLRKPFNERDVKDVIEKIEK